MHADVTGQALQLAGQLQQGAHVFFLALTLGQKWFSLQRIDQLVAFAALGRQQLQRHGLARFVRDQF